MGADDDLGASLAHVVLCIVSANGSRRFSRADFVHPGMHMNLFIHGILGILHYQSDTFGDLCKLYTISLKASKYLPIPCLMADLYASKKEISLLHVLSGLIPFGMALSGQEDAQLGSVVIAINILSLIYYSVDKKNDWGLLSAMAGILAYFVAPASGVKATYPLCLVLLETCTLNMVHQSVPVGAP